jgi:RimJ/RimL family protein N-acetyltransferase
MSISFANLSDIREISRMANLIWHEYFYPDILSMNQIEYMLMKFQTERDIIDQIQNHGYQYGFIFDGDKKAGYFAVHPEVNALFISKVYLFKEFRGKGLGSETLRELLELGKSQGFRRAYLTVNVNNLKACKAYERNGFRIEKDVNTDIGEGYFMNDHIYEYVY